MGCFIWIGQLIVQTIVVRLLSALFNRLEKRNQNPGK
jgi:hypothetical protein